MKRTWLPLALLVVVGACGGGTPAQDDTGGAGGATAAPTTGGGGAAPAGDVVNRQPPGQGAASVDGQEFSFDTPGGLACKVTDEEVSFSFIIGDNEITMGGGATKSGGAWFGSLSMRVVAADGTTEYVAKLIDNPDRVAVDGNSVSYSGPVDKYPPAPPGEIPTGIAVGDGVFTATCA